MAGSATIGALRVVIGADAADLNKGLSDAEKRLSSFAKSITPAVTAVSAIGAAGTAAAAALTTSLVKSSLDTIDAQSKLAYRLQATVIGIQAIQAAADLAGVSSDDLTTSIEKLDQRLAEAARTGTGPAYEGLRRLGLSAKDLLNLDVDDRLGKIADRMNELGYSAAQQADILRQLGIRQQGMIALLQGGSQSFKDAKNDVIAYGKAVTDIDAANIERANDAWTRAHQALEGVSNQLAVALSPLIYEVGNRLAEAGKASGGFSAEITQAVRTAITVVALLQQKIYDLRIFLDEAFNLEIKAKVPDWITALSGGTLTGEVTLFKNEFGQLRDTLEKPLSAAEWLKWFDTITQRANVTASIVAGISRAATAPPKTDDPLTEQQRKQREEQFTQLQRSLASQSAALDVWREQEQKKLDDFNAYGVGSEQARYNAQIAIDANYWKQRNDMEYAAFDEATATEAQQLAKKYADQLQVIAEFEAAHTDLHNRAEAARKKLEEKYAQDSIMLQARTWAAVGTTIDTAMANIQNAFGGKAGTMFEVLKAISIATAVVKGAEAVVSAWATGNATGIPGFGAVLAAATAAGVAAQIAIISRTKPGGAASGSSVTAAASSSTPAAAAAAPPPQAPQTLFINGINRNQFFSGAAVRDLAETLIEFQRNGGQIVLDKG